MENENLPKTLLEAVRFFTDLDICTQFMAAVRWPDGVTCPHCTATRNSFNKARRYWQCKDCRKQFTIKTGSVMEDSPIGLDKWLPAIWMIVNAKNGVSSYEIHRALGITQKSAWFLLHRIRLKHDRERKIKGTGGYGKVAVMGLLERHGEVRVHVVGDRRRKSLDGSVREHVEAGSHVYSDALKSYN